MLGWLLALFRRRVSVGRPVRIAGDVRVRFEGSGRARFRLQHAADRGGEPDELSWCDVTPINGPDQARSIDVKDLSVRDNRVLVDWLNGPAEVIYRRHAASWLRVVPHDDDDETVKRCKRYRVSMVLIRAAAA